MYSLRNNKWANLQFNQVASICNLGKPKQKEYVLAKRMNHSQINNHKLLYHYCETLVILKQISCKYEGGGHSGNFDNDQLFCTEAIFSSS